MKRYLTEFIGTFFLALTVVLAVNGTAGGFAPLAIGAILMVMIYAGGHISGAHYNPAVTIGIWIRGKITAADVPGYIIAQLLGAGLAALTGGYLLAYTGEGIAIQMGGVFSISPGFVSEFLGTLALVWVVLNVATAKDTSGNSFYGLAIGFTVLAGAYIFGGITGAAFNPAVALAASIAGMTPWANFGTFLLGQLAGAAVAAMTFGFINGKE